ncbi:MAG: carboxylesterase family protein, partial [Eubacterium sp.]|nr:carboxylesterase family protein [Eubacterium sp.]
GGKVLNLLQMPPADGLYHKAIIMAGVLPETKLYPPRSYSRQLAENTMNILGLKPEEYTKLITMDYKVLSEAALKAMREAAAATGYRATWSQPVSEGFFTGFPLEVGIRPESAKIPLMIGSVQGERNSDVRRWCTDPVIVGSNKNTWDARHTEEAMRIWFGGNYEAVMDEYPKAYPEKKIQDSIFTDMGHRASILKICGMRGEIKDHADTFLYYFNPEFPVNGGTVAWHGSELPFVFHSASYHDPLWLPDGRTTRLEQEMCAAWAAFAHSGNPNNSLIPKLPACDTDHYATIVWGDETTVRYDHDRKLVGLLPQLTLPNDIAGYAMG